VTVTIQPGQWVRPLWVTEDGPMAGWRFLDGIGDTMWRWQKVLLFSDNYSVPIHVANLGRARRARTSAVGGLRHRARGA
jgi:hypothetical protein